MFDSDDDEEEEDYDLPPDEDELDLPDEEDESDELDDLEDPRVTEVDSEEEDETVAMARKVMKGLKGKNKRAHDESDDDVGGTVKTSLDEIISKTLKPAAPGASEQVNGEENLSKKQLKKMRKKLKDNAGNAVETTVAMTTPSEKDDIGVPEAKANPSPGSGAKSDKKVQFAKTLVQGPSSESSKGEEAKSKVNGDTNQSSKAAAGPRTIQGVTVDDKKLGSGPAAKKGDKVSMRYIGKLEKDKKVFDCTCILLPSIFDLPELYLTFVMFLHN